MKAISITMYALAVVLLIAVVSVATLGISNHNFVEELPKILYMTACGVVAFCNGKVAGARVGYVAKRPKCVRRIVFKIYQ